jgi:hypothetical protein
MFLNRGIPLCISRTFTSMGGESGSSSVAGKIEIFQRVVAQWVSHASNSGIVALHA